MKITSGICLLYHRIIKGPMYVHALNRSLQVHWFHLWSTPGADEDGAHLQTVVPVMFSVRST